MRALIDDVEHWLADEPVGCYREPPLAASGAGPAAAFAWWRVWRFWSPPPPSSWRWPPCSSIVRSRRGLPKGTREPGHRGSPRAGPRGKSGQGENPSRPRETTLKQTLASYHQSADSYLAAAHCLAAMTDNPHRQAEALDLLGNASQLGLSAQTVLSELGDAGRSVSDFESRTWDQRTASAPWRGLALARHAGNPLRNHDFSASRADPGHSHGGCQFRRFAGRADLRRPAGSHVGRRRGTFRPRTAISRGLQAISTRRNICNTLRFRGDGTVELANQGQLLRWTLPGGEATVRPQSAAEIRETQRNCAAETRPVDPRRDLETRRLSAT